MGGAEAANLIVTLSLRDQLSPGLAKVQSGLGRIAGAFTSFGGRIKNIITGPLSLLNLAIGRLVTDIGSRLISFVTDSIAKLQDLAYATEKVAGLTGLTAEKASTLVAVFGKFNIDATKTTQIIGFAEKTLGMLNRTVDKSGVSKLTKLTNQYGVSLKDARGKVVDFQTELLRVADYYNSNASASDKAAFAAKLFGRGYAQLIPVLKLGSKGILDAEKAAKDLGLVLTAQNAKDLKDYREAMREAGDAVGGLQLQIGLALVPELIKLSKAATEFIRNNRDKIIQFFKDGLKTAEDMGAAIQKYVVPAFQTIASAWNAVPDDLKKFLIGGFIANKLTGGAVGAIAGGVAKAGIGAAAGLAGGALGSLRGSTPATPVFVSDVGGLAGKAAGAIGGASALDLAAGGVAGISTVAAVVIPLALLAAAGAWARGNIGQGGAPINLRGNAFGQNTAGTPGNVPLGYFGKGPSPNDIPGFGPASALTARAQAQAMKNAADAAADDAREFAALSTVTSSLTNHMRDEFMTRQSLYRREKKAIGKENQFTALATDGKKTAILTADALAAKFEHSQAPFYRSARNQERAISSLEKLQRRFLAVGDTASARKIGADIAGLKAAIKPPSVYVDVTTSIVGIQAQSTTFSKYSRNYSVNNRGK